MSEIKKLLKKQMMFAPPKFVTYCSPNHSVIIGNEKGEGICPSCQQKRFDIVAEHERQRILDGIQEIEDQSHRTKTPLFQDTLFKLVREVING